jgi:hypothetical protein
MSSEEDENPIDTTWIQHGSPRSRRFFAFFGFESPRRKRERTSEE